MRTPTPAELLFAEGHAFDFFEAVRLLELLAPERQPVGRGGPPAIEVARFRTHQSLTFPPSAVHRIDRPTDGIGPPVVQVAFLGLTGALGALPSHYTELLLRHEREGRGKEKHALRDWLDLFNHRLVSLFYRTWEKYRFYVPYSRDPLARASAGLAARLPADRPGAEGTPFTRTLFALIGLGPPPLRDRLCVTGPAAAPNEEPPRVLARVEDLALLHYSGFLSHRPRCAVSLEAMLGDYFGLPIRIVQFTGQWLHLDPTTQTRLEDEGPSELGVNAVAGERVWDALSKFRVRVGPLPYAAFADLLPDRAAVPQRKTFFLLAKLVRLYVGAELDFEVQLVLRAADVPACELTDGDEEALGPRLGWNTWVFAEPFDHDAEDAFFEGEEGELASEDAPAFEDAAREEAAGAILDLSGGVLTV